MEYVDSSLRIATKSNRLYPGANLCRDLIYRRALALPAGDQVYKPPLVSKIKRELFDQEGSQMDYTVQDRA